MSTVRDRVRAEMIDEIKACARRQLTTIGSDLSLRAIARELGLVSSALYRYFASRDDLLTALIVDGYTDLADHVSAAEAAIPRDAPAVRFATVGRAVRGWAVEHRAEYALLYGSPIPGYVAPAETVVPVARINLVVIDILMDAERLGPPVGRTEIPAGMRHDIEEVLARLDRPELPPERMARGFTAWASLFGVISFELFGHSVGVTHDLDALFEVQLAGLVQSAGFA